jgi:hypothetical protein
VDESTARGDRIKKRRKGGKMPELNKAIIKALAALETVQAQLEKVGWEVCRFEVQETFDSRERLVIFLAPIEKEG